jgi:hypothetical protein
MLPEVWDAVSVVKDFDAKYGFDEVFEGDDTDGGDEVVGDEHDVETLGDEALKESVNGCVFRCDGDWRKDINEGACVIVIFEVSHQSISTDGKPNKIIASLETAKTNTKPPSAGCHETWRNDSPVPPVSSLISSIRTFPFFLRLTG